MIHRDGVLWICKSFAFPIDTMRPSIERGYGVFTYLTSTNGWDRKDELRESHAALEMMAVRAWSTSALRFAI